MKDKILELIMVGELELAEKLSKAAGFSIDKELHATAITGYPLFSVSYIALPLDRVGVRVQFEIDGITDEYVTAKLSLNHWK